MSKLIIYLHSQTQHCIFLPQWLQVSAITATKTKTTLLCLTVYVYNLVIVFENTAECPLLRKKVLRFSERLVYSN